MSTIGNHSHWPIGPAILAGAVLSAMCISPGSTLAQHDSPTAGTPKAATATPARHHWRQFGKASWYGGAFQGQATASGEPFNMNSMTCAHRSLPLGATVLVTNLRNHRSVLVRVNDRGPVPENRILNLCVCGGEDPGFSGYRTGAD